MHEGERATRIVPAGKKAIEFRGAMVRVDDEGFDPVRAEMIERERDQRFLKNRDERLRQIFRHRAESQAESRAENESLPDHRRAPSAVLVLGRDFGKTELMAEETIWRGTSSQIKNLGCFILCVLFCWLIVPIFIALSRYLQTKNNVFELTSERLKITEGVFSKVTETLELYRVKDIEVLQPFFSRMFGVENIKINTSDMSSPVILLEAIPKSVALADKLRNQVEIIRVQKNVREIDLE
jgi:membrane protein YdbS with pleckstrin-like domain